MRLFVAIELSEAVRTALQDVQRSLAGGCDGVRWTPHGQLHLTVKFLGEVPDSQLPRVVQAVASGASMANPFGMQIAGCGCFPHRAAVRIVWAGVSDASGALPQCVHVVGQELERIGFPKERQPFSPHITIGRVGEDRSQGRIRRAAEAFSLALLEQRVESVTLMSSVLSPKGPTYAAVSQADLGTAATSKARF